ncbi:hypothetical protein HK405_015338, partial [Cladochytrium tenue]
MRLVFVSLEGEERAVADVADDVSARPPPPTSATKRALVAPTSPRRPLEFATAAPAPAASPAGGWFTRTSLVCIPGPGPAPHDGGVGGSHGSNLRGKSLLSHTYAEPTVASLDRLAPMPALWTSGPLPTQPAGPIAASLGSLRLHSGPAAASPGRAALEPLRVGLTSVSASTLTAATMPPDRPTGAKLAKLTGSTAIPGAPPAHAARSSTLNSSDHLFYNVSCLRQRHTPGLLRLAPDAVPPGIVVRPKAIVSNPLLPPSLNTRPPIAATPNFSSKSEPSIPTEALCRRRSSRHERDALCVVSSPSTLAGPSSEYGGHRRLLNDAVTCGDLGGDSAGVVAHALGVNAIAVVAGSVSGASGSRDARVLHTDAPIVRPIAYDTHAHGGAVIRSEHGGGVQQSHDTVVVPSSRQMGRRMVCVGPTRGDDLLTDSVVKCGPPSRLASESIRISPESLLRAFTETRSDCEDAPAAPLPAITDRPFTVSALSSKLSTAGSPGFTSTIGCVPLTSDRPRRIDSASAVVDGVAGKVDEDAEDAESATTSAQEQSAHVLVLRSAALEPNEGARDGGARGAAACMHPSDAAASAVAKTTCSACD